MHKPIFYWMQKIASECTHGIAMCYHALGITRVITDSDRYEELRPVDAMLLHTAILIFVVCGMPILCIAWTVGLLPISLDLLILLNALLFVIPPLIIYGVCEYLLRKLKSR